MQPLVPFAKRYLSEKLCSFSEVTVRRLSVLVIMILVFGNSGIYAQNANLYAFSTNNTGSFVLDRNGATVNMGSGTTQLIGSSQDDVASSVTNIGFSFNFMGAAFTQFTASSNGALRLGGSAISTTTIGTSFPVNNQSIIAPYLQDIETHSNGKVHYKLIGSSPNRTLVVEFLNMRINFNSSSSDATFQVRLYETTNVIEFVYGNMSVGSTSTASSNTANARSVVIGFSNDNDANEEISVNQSTYATTTNSSPIVNTNSSTGTIAGLNGTSDGSRRRFTFIPPTVNTGTITGSPFCQGAAVTVPFTSSGTFTSNTYTAQLSSSTGSFASPTNIGTLVSNANSGNINATIPANATPGTGYRIRVNSSNANVLVFANTVNLTINGRPTVSGATSVCVGGSTNVTPSSGGTWSSSDEGIATVDNSGDVVGVSAGTATLTFTDGTTGCTNTVALTVTGSSTLVRNTGAGTDAQTVCQGTAIANLAYLVGGSGTGASITAGSLPTGVTGTYNGGTKLFTISGTPTQSGSFSFTVTTTGPCGNVSLNGTLNVTASSTLTLSSGVGTNVQTVCINNSINAVFYTIGGTATGASITAGSLPTGVTGSFDGDLNEFSITGTPTVAGTFNFTVSSTGPCPVSLTGTITVNDNSTLSLFSGSDNQTRCINTAITSIVYQVGGGGTGGTVTGLPTGVTGVYNGGNKRITISGTPTVSGTFNYTVNTTGPCINTSLGGTIVVEANSTITLTSANNNQTICENTALANITYSLGGGATGATVTGLPAGITGSFDAGVYTIEGTATASGTFNYTVTATGPCVNPSLNGTIVVNPAPVVNLSANPGTVCFTGNSTLTVTNSGGTTSPTYAGTGAGVGIPNWSASAYTYSSVTLNAGSETLSSSDVLQVTLNINHNEDQDLDIYLVDPSGTRAILLSSDNGGSGNNYTNTVLSTAASNVIGSTGNNSAPFTGTFRPEGTITTTPDRNGAVFGGNYNSVVPGNALDGAPITGAWTLRVFDDGFATTGSLVNWSLSITKPAQAYVTTFSGPATITPDAPIGLNTTGTAVVNGPVGNNSYTATTTDALGCSTTSAAAIVTVNPVPDAPISGGDQTVCENGNPTQTLTATATGGDITWYDQATNGNLVGSPVQIGVGSVTYYAEASNGLCSSFTRTPVTLTILAAPVAVGSDQTVCQDNNPSQTLTASAIGGTITWFDQATNGAVVPSPVQVGVGSTTYYAEAFDGTCTSLSRAQVVLTILAAPAAPLSGGDQTVCQDGNPTQTLTATATGGDITWYDLATNGAVVPSPVQVGAGSITYYAESSDGTCSSLTRTPVTLTINAAPAAPVASNQSICYTGNPTQTLTATATGGTITWYDQANGGSVVVNPSQVGIGQSTYYAESFDGTCTSLTRTAVTLKINIPPATPAAIIGEKNVCPYVGTADLVTYSIVPVPFAETYRWTLPPFVNLVSAAPDSTSITVTFDEDFGTSPNRQIRVRSISPCGNSGQAIIYLTSQFASTPAPISGPTDVCPFLGNANEATYTIPKVTAATAYIWTIPAGVNATHPNGPGVNDTVIVVTFDNSFATSAITVRSSNDCGTSSARSITINRNLPPTPGLISGPTNACSFIGPGGNDATYSIRKVQGAIAYTWTAPNEADITHLNAAGPNDTAITVRFPHHFNNGAISVTATSGCGTSPSPRNLSVGKLNPATPGVIDVIQLVTCPNREFSYTIAGMPSNATFIQWSVPSGAISFTGQGTTSITVTYPSTAVSGRVTATAFSNCGQSVGRSTEVKLAPCAPPPPFTGKGNEQPSTVKAVTSNDKMDVNIFPNPTTSSFNLQVLTAGKEQVKVRIMDIQGRLFKTITVSPYQQTTFGSELKAGTYVIEITQGKQKSVQQLVKL